MKRSDLDDHLVSPPTPPITVRHSAIHGNGVFATRKIPADTRVIEYAGDRVTARQAASRKSADPDNPFHTFFFSLENGRLIDGASNGNDARWINHCCEPNCEAREEDGRIFIYSLRDIRRGEELNYDYGLVVAERHTPAVKRAYACFCGAENCRKTMLALKRKPRQKRGETNRYS
jgi:SET domain-containing protein